jgi:ornithine cyclodeaminase
MGEGQQTSPSRAVESIIIKDRKRKYEMSKIYSLPQIMDVLKSLQPIKEIEEGFVAYSAGKAVIPPVGEMLFKDPPGETHIKYGYLVDDDYYVIKIASGFFESPSTSRYTSDGLILLFKKGTGELACALLDECHLTNVRTAAAGAVSAKYLAPKNIDCIGILGAGTQGRMQVEYLATARRSWCGALIRKNWMITKRTWNLWGTASRRP